MSPIHYPFGEELPIKAEAKAISHEVRWVRMPLPFALNHINLWLLKDEIDGVTGWTLVDCGIADEGVRVMVCSAVGWYQAYATCKAEQPRTGTPAILVPEPNPKPTNPTQNGGTK